MPYKPSDIFLTVADVFVVLLPGAILIGGIASLLFPSSAAEFSGSATAWAVLLAASFVVGSLVSGVASLVEDRLSKTDLGRERIRKEERAFRDEVEAALKTDLFSLHVAELNVRRVAGLFVRLRSAPLAAALSRRDADRRFLRNLIAVVALTGSLAIARVTARTLAPLRIALVAASVIGLLGLLALIYTKQDEKHTRDTFDYFLALRGLGRFKKDLPAAPPGAAPSMPTEGPAAPPRT